MLSLMLMPTYRSPKKKKAEEAKLHALMARQIGEAEGGAKEKVSILIAPLTMTSAGQTGMEPVTQLTPASDSACYLACEGSCSRTVRDSRTHQVIRTQSEEEKRNFLAGFQFLFRRLPHPSDLNIALGFFVVFLLIFGPANFGLWYGTYRSYLHFDGVAALIITAICCWGAVSCALGSLMAFALVIHGFTTGVRTILSNLKKRRGGGLKLLPISALPGNICPSCLKGQLMLRCIGKCTRAVVCSEDRTHLRLATQEEVQRFRKNS